MRWASAPACWARSKTHSLSVAYRRELADAAGEERDAGIARARARDARFGDFGDSGGDAAQDAAEDSDRDDARDAS